MIFPPKTPVQINSIPTPELTWKRTSGGGGLVNAILLENGVDAIELENGAGYISTE